MAITYAQISAAISAALLSLPSLPRIQNYDEMTDGMNDLPTVQVYPESCEDVAESSSTHVSTFGGGVIQETHTFHIDYYSRQRGHIGEDMDALVDGIDEMVTLLEDETCPPFGLVGVRSFQWSWKRVSFEYAGIRYAGARFILKLRTF